MRERLARVTLMRLAEPGDAVMGRLVASCGPEAAVEQVRRRVLDPEFVRWFASTRRGRPAEGTGEADARLDRILAAWAARLEAADPAGDLAAGERAGARLVVPGEPEWPTQLDDLLDSRPHALWLHGQANLRFACIRSVAIVGSRAATPYGAHVAAEFGAGLSERGHGVVSGGAYGVDGAAHRGALAGGTPTVAVLACGTDVSYPSAHHDLFEVVRARGLLVSESPMGVRPTRPRFLVRNRIIAALARGTVVIEAAVRSGALNTAGHAVALNRILAAVPGPVTSDTSTGCHRLIRQGAATCVTTPAEMAELVGAIGSDLAPEPRGPVLPRDRLAPEVRRVLEAVPARAGAGPAVIAVEAGVDLETVLSCLGGLAAAGYVEKTSRGWRLCPEKPSSG
ncbi:DNA-processing protein DprA [Planomonospora sp. ID91781]|uniref:DNA-processing protein DprA n=1 Tax=Planomonospora sp. ID91781 TaxID=2738135 RepID=UPI0027DDCA00|nr:DNA-processing protein DprA [Planomonospora sp. ID91781]